MFRPLRWSDVNSVFRDVKGEGPMPVETLLIRSTATVVDVPDAGSVVVDDMTQIDASLPVHGGQVPMQIQVCEDDQLWFTSEHALEVGQTISQVTPVANVDQMFNLFIDAWTKRWDKHKDLPVAQWDHIVGFLEVALPCRRMQLQPLTVSRWIEEVQRKPAKAAGGLDGVDRNDLAHLTFSQQQVLVDILRDVEVTGSWPQQLLHGAIFSLQKSPQAESVDGYRPITILPLVYRVWSSLRGREMLQHLQSFLPGTLCGSANKQSAMSVWYAVQAQIEQSFLDEASLCGAIADITKAFNCLPRVPLVGAAVITGVASEIVRPWMGMLTGLQRHFMVRNQISRGVTSTTGFAEGCCLSVGAMLLANIALHTYMTVASPSVRLWSYIDNWEVLSDSPEELDHGLKQLNQFATILDLTMDANKAMVWAVDPQHRRQLRQGDTPVVTHARDLGGHMQFTRQLTCKTLVDRCDALQPMWGRLGRSFAPRALKHKVLRMKAWPSALHSSPGVHVSDAVLRQLRSAAMQSLRLTKAGTNASLYLGLCLHPMHDPECYVLINCLRNVRKWIPENVFAAYACDIAFTPDRQRVPGPQGVLFDRLERISWTWICDAWWVDHLQQPINLYQCCVQELSARAIQGFQASVGRKVASRHGFEGMPDVDAFTTTLSMKHLDSDEVGLIRSLHVGVFITAEQTGQANHVDETKWICKFCGSRDSLEHRHWQCPDTAKLRQNLSREFFDWLAQQPMCTRQRGWATMPDAVGSYLASLMAIQDRSDVFHVQVQPGQEYTFFTDGAALDPQIRSSRLVAWAWCVAKPGDWSFQLGGQGGVPGFWQTVVRAELLAVISVFQFCYRQTCGGTIICDNEYVVKRVRTMLTQSTDIVDNVHTDNDLWLVLDALVRSVGHRMSIVHIYSHQSSEDEAEAIRWACRGNDFADNAAQEAFQCLPEEVLNLQRAAHDAIVQQRKHHKQLMTYMASVGKMSLQAGQQVHQPNVEIPRETGVEPLAVQTIVNEFEGRVPYHFQMSEYDKWLQWLATISDLESPVRWVSWLELLIHFQATTERLGVICFRGESGNLRRWMPVDDETTVTWPTLIASFGRYGTSMIRLRFPNWKVCHRKPHMWRIKFWLSCVPVRMRPGVVRCIEEFFTAHNIQGLNSTKEMIRYPFARP